MLSTYDSCMESIDIALHAVRPGQQMKVRDAHGFFTPETRVLRLRSCVGGVSAVDYACMLCAVAGSSALTRALSGLACELSDVVSAKFGKTISRALASGIQIAARDEMFLQIRVRRPEAGVSFSCFYQLLRRSDIPSGRTKLKPHDIFYTSFDGEKPSLKAVYMFSEVHRLDSSARE